MSWNTSSITRLLKRKGLSRTERDFWRAVHDRVAFAEGTLQSRAGGPWRVRPYQRASLRSYAMRKVHCDGRDVGKTTEIELLCLWCAVAMPGREALVATQCENHLYPLMHRVARRFESDPLFARSLAEIKRTPSWHIRFTNGFTLWGRIAGPRGVNFQGLHVDFQIVDEAQEMTDASWGELFQALNGGGRRWVYGVPNGLRNGFYRMTQEADAEQYNWPSSLNPDFDAAKDEELARLYGGRQSPGYLHRVLGRHGAPAHGVFDLDDYLGCIEAASDAWEIHLTADEDADMPSPPSAGRYYLGCDLGYAQDPSEFIVYRTDGPDLVCAGRLQLRGVNYRRQESIIRELHAAYRFSAIGIDAGNSGRAVAHGLLDSAPELLGLLHTIEFGGSVVVGERGDGTPERVPAKAFMTELLQRRLAERTIRFPPSADREEQYAGHTSRTGPSGRTIYDKGNDHIIDADRCAVFAHWLDTREDDATPLGVRLHGF